MLGPDWTPEIGLDGCVMAILFLFYNPQLDDALSLVFSGSGECADLAIFAENVKISMCGGEIEGCTFDNIMINEFDEEKENTDNKPDDHNDKCESSGILPENISLSTPGGDKETNSIMDKAVEGEAVVTFNEKELDEHENGELLNKTNYVEPMKDEANIDTNENVPVPINNESASFIVQNFDVDSVTTAIENTTCVDRTSHGHHNDPLVPCDALGNKISDENSTDNKNVASSIVERNTDLNTDLVLDLHDVQNAKTHNRQTIVIYIKSKLNIFSGLFKMIARCKGILPRR